MIRDINNIDDSIIKAKRIIKEKLYSDQDIIEVLNNPKLNPDEPDTYLDENIFDYIRVPGTTTDTKNFICFDIKQQSMNVKNQHMRDILFIFNVWVNEDNMKTPYGISRHDLLGYLIRDIFNYSNILGAQLVEIADVPGIMDAYSSSRTITFKAIQPASLNEAVKTNKYEFENFHRRIL